MNEDRLAAIEAKLDHLTNLVESLLAQPPQPAVDDDEPWRRLGLTEGERRIVTVLFADVSGFTELSEQLDPEAFQLVMRDTMSLLASCVTEQGGTLEKFIGDALCAIFGAPVAHPDEPERAAQAALAMHEVLAERAASRPDLPALEVHIGINTGPVIAGAVGDGSQFGVMGDTINTAARLMNLAVHGETFVSAETARRLRRGYRLQDRGLHEVKGKAKPVAASALLGELAPDERAAARRLRAPLLGRDRELRTLRRLADRAADGDGCSVVLVGPSGVGTSRLAEELAGDLPSQGWRVLSASARVQAETPLGLVASALGPLLAEGAGTVAGGTKGPLAEALLAGGVAAPHDFELVLGEVVTATARESPLLVVIDGAENADPGSLEVVRYLSRSTGDERVLWVLAACEVPPPFEALLGSDDVVVVRVEPLADADVGAIFEALFPGALTDGQKERLAHLAEGSAQFAEEIALALLDDGALVEGDDGRWTAVGDIDARELPGSVSELVEARIDELSTVARVTLQDASVIGQRFSRRLLERVATIPTSLDAALGELVEEELVVPGDGDGGEGGGLWSFRSRLVREVAYGSVLRRRCPPAHRAVAEALLELEPDRVRENADLLAHHFEESDDPPVAVTHLLVAVEGAENAFNLVGALDRARRALRLRDRFPGRVGDADAALLLQRVGINKLLLGDRTGLGELESAVALLGSSGATPSAVAGLEERVGWYLTADGRPDDAEAHLQRAESLSPTPTVLAGIAVTRSLRTGAMGDLVGALASVRRIDADDTFVQTRADLVTGVLLLWSGSAEEAAAHLRSALDVAWRQVHGTLADRCGRWLVTALVEAGHGEEAEELARPLLARADDRGDPTVACGVRAALAQRRRRTGEVVEARRLVAEAVALAVGVDRRVAADAAAETHLVAAQLALDEAEGGGAEAMAVAVHEAERHLADLQAVQASDAWLAWRWSARAALLRGRVALLRDDVDAAVACAVDARAAAASAGAQRELLAADRLEGEARARAGDPAGVELVRSALERAESLGDDWLVTTTRGVLDRVTVAS